MDHPGGAVHHLVAGNDMGACFHQASHSAAIKGTFNDKIGDYTKFRIMFG